MKLTRRFGGFVAFFIGIAVFFALCGHSPCRADDSTTSKASADSSVKHASGNAELAQVQLAYRGLLLHRGHRRHLRAMPLYPQPQAESLPNSVDLRPFFEKWGLEPRLQRSRNTCSVFVIAECIEYALATKQKHGTRLSIEFLNWAANEKAANTRTARTSTISSSATKPSESAPKRICPIAKNSIPPRNRARKRSRTPRTFGSLNLNLHWIKEWDDRQGRERKTACRNQEACSTVIGRFAAVSFGRNAKRLDNSVLSVVPRSGRHRRP